MDNYYNNIIYELAMHTVNECGVCKGSGLKSYRDCKRYYNDYFQYDQKEYCPKCHKLREALKVVPLTPIALEKANSKEYARALKRHKEYLTEKERTTFEPRQDCMIVRFVAAKGVAA